MNRTATLFFLALLLAATTAFCQLPYYIVDIDIQTPEEDFLIPRAYSGSNPFVAFDIWDNNSAWSVSNNDWAFTFAYSYDQSFSEGGVILTGSNSDSNRVYFLGATQQLFKADEYWCEIVGVHTSGYKKTFASGKLIEIYSATAYTNVAELSGQIQWLGLPNLVQSNQMGNATWDGTNGWRFPDSGTFTNTLTKPTNTWVSGYVLASSDTGLTTYATASSGGACSGITTNIIGGTNITVRNGDTAEATIDFDATGIATGTPLYAYTETDPVWESEKASYATGTPLYAYTETDPVWESEKGSYATGTPLYVETYTGDFKADGSVPMTGDLETGTNNIFVGATGNNAYIAFWDVGNDSYSTLYADAGTSKPAWQEPIGEDVNLLAYDSDVTNKVSKTGDTMTGPLTINATASNDIVIASSSRNASVIIGGAITNDSTYGAVAIGGGAYVSSASGSQYGPIAIGLGAQALDYSSVAIGPMAKSMYYSGVAIGDYAQGSGYGVAVGAGANNLLGDGAVVGFNARSDNGGVALAREAYARKLAISIGRSSDATTNNIAIGYASHAEGETKIAIGANVSNAVDNSAAIRGSLYLDGGTGIFFRTTFGTGDWGPALIVKSMSGTNELVAVDPDGNETQLSAHDVIDGKMVSVAKSHNTFTGRGIMIDLEAMAREVEKLSGSKIVREYKVPKADWNLVEAQKEANRIADRAAWSNQFAAFSANPLILVTNIVDGIEEIKEEGTPDPGPLPPTYKPRPKPGWLVAAESVEVEK